MCRPCDALRPTLLFYPLQFFSKHFPLADNHRRRYEESDASDVDDEDASDDEEAGEEAAAGTVTLSSYSPCGVID